MIERISILRQRMYYMLDTLRNEMEAFMHNLSINSDSVLLFGAKCGIIILLILFGSAPFLFGLGIYTVVLSLASLLGIAGIITKLLVIVILFIMLIEAQIAFALLALTLSVLTVLA